jgi:ATP-dependent Clp protease ATP-binding subunit ClpC
MTSNVGARLITEPKRLGFTSANTEKAKTYDEMKNNVMGELKNTFRPEFLNRVDEIIVFHPLEEEHLKSIVGLMIESLAKRLRDNAIALEVSEDAKMLLAKKGFDQVYGARPLRRAIQSMVEDKLAEEMLEGRVRAGDKVLIKSKDDDLVFSKE